MIVGNPPYSVGKAAPTTTTRISSTPRSTARSSAPTRAIDGAEQESLYDSYIRAMRWASDRIGDDGVVAFVSNGGWIDGNTADGIRLSLAEEFSELYVYNLRGNQRTAGELSARRAARCLGRAAATPWRSSSRSGTRTHRPRDDPLPRYRRLPLPGGEAGDRVRGLARVDRLARDHAQRGRRLGAPAQRRVRDVRAAERQRRRARPERSSPRSRAVWRPAGTPGSTPPPRQRFVVR